jgi:hypothetical protein
MSGRHEIADAVSALELSPDGMLSWRRRQIGGLEGRLRRLPPDQRRKYLRQQITDCLYSRFYTRGGGPEPLASVERSTRATPEIDRLAQIYRHKDSWTGGWELVEQQGARSSVRRGGITVWTSSREVRNPAADSRVEVRLPAVAERLSPGFLLLRGALDLDMAARGRVLRLYWNILPGGAELLFKNLTVHFDEGLLPYRLKILRALRSEARCDAAVLYLPAAGWHTARTFLEERYSDMAAWLGPRTPAFTLRLAPGLAVAEDPPSGESFGRNRSQLLADGLLDAWENGIADPDRRIAAVCDGILAKGFDPENLHLDAGSREQYPFAPKPAGSIDRGTTETTEPNTKAKPAVDSSADSQDEADVDCLAIARTLAANLIDRAWWRDSRCTWVGATPISSDDGRRRGPETWTSLRPDLYGGLAGVAFFLAELNAVAPDPQLESTARRALAAALAMDDKAGDSASPGLFTGRMGVAVVEARMGLLADDRASIRSALERGERAAALREGANSDVIAGKAGALLGLLILAEISRETRPIELAVSLGDRIAGLAVARGGGVAWGAKEGPWPLTGYAHGATGIAHALAELHHRTGLRRFAELAQEAGRYEHLAFDPVALNWPDFRLEPGDPVLPRGHYPTGTLWCHGATGVLIGMRRMAAILDTPTADLDIDRARAAVRRQVHAEIAAPAASWCLCHGICGDALALIHGGPMAASDERDFALVSRLARAGEQRYRESKDWPCGVGGGWSPAYMVGTAGTGALYLGLARPQTPSFLMPIPSMFAA